MIILGIDDFERCAALSKQVGKWQAWRNHYFPKYETIFGPMLKYLYRCDVEGLESAVQNFDFDQALVIANRFLKENNLPLIRDLIKKSEKECAFDRDYDLYLLVGLGHVDGSSLPASSPFLYLGIERYESPARFEYLVPHEYNHLVRIWSLYDGNLPMDIALGEMIVMEGLAVVFAAVVAGSIPPCEAG